MDNLVQRPKWGGGYNNKYLKKGAVTCVSISMGLVGILKTGFDTKGGGVY